MSSLIWDQSVDFQPLWNICKCKVNEKRLKSQILDVVLPARLPQYFMILVLAASTVFNSFSSLLHYEWQQIAEKGAHLLPFLLCPNSFAFIFKGLHGSTLMKVLQLKKEHFFFYVFTRELERYKFWGANCAVVVFSHQTWQCASVRGDPASRNRSP